MSLAARIRELRLELAALEEQQRAELRAAIVAAFPPGGVFSTVQVWQQPALRAACIAAGLTTIRRLGVWLRAWLGAGLTRIARDEAGVVWAVSETDLQDDAGIPIDDGG